MQKSFTYLASLLVLLLLALPRLGRAQNLTQADFTGVLVPQYLSNGNNSGSAAFAGPRLAVVFRATLTSLTPATTYRYYVQAAQQSEFGAAASGAGIVLLINPGPTPAATTYLTSSTGSLGTAGQYATFTTDAAGSYTGWFGFINSNNATRFQTPGTVLFPTITLATEAAPATIVARRALNQSLTVLAFAGAAGATNATLLTGQSAATPKNLVFTYDNVAGTGRPLSSAVVESIGIASGTTQTGANAYTYSTTDGAYTTVVPNTLAPGVRRLEQRSVVDGSLVGCASDADGTWPSGTNTRNPSGGTTALTLTATDALLNISACGSAPAGPTLTASPAGPLTFSTTAATPSAAQTLTIGGSSLTAAITVTASAGYEVALAAAGPYAATATVAAPAGTAPATAVYVRLASAPAPGPVNGTLTVASAGATSQTLTLNGAVTVALAAPTVSSFTPTSGAAGTVVTITGTGFVDVSAVTLNGTAITGYTVVNATTITFTVPAGASSGVLAVTTAGGTATSSTSFMVNVPVVPAPTITALSPARVLAGGPAFVLTLTGTNLTSATTVSFNGATYTAASAAANSSSLTVNIPAPAIATAGAYPVTVTNAGGTSAALTLLVVAPASVVAYEDFELGAARTGYTDAAPVALRSGAWTFTQALVGDLATDRANQLRAARVRGGGSIAMNFDKPNGAGTVTISAALFGSDTGASFTAEVSADGGATYQPIAGAPATLTSTLTPYPLTVNRTGNVRLRFSSTNTTAGQNPRINLDDLTITNFTGTATRASQALPGLRVFPNPTRATLSIALPKAGAARVVLRDLTGRLVLAPAALPATGRLTLPVALPAGTYLLEVQQGAETAVRRVVKE